MLKWISKKRNRKGFTLVELVVVIAILGILAAIAVPKLSKSRESAAIAAHNANVRTLESAATLAVSEGGLDFGDDGNITWGNGNDDNKTWEDYLQSWPEVPTGVAGREYTVEGSSENETIESSYTVTIGDDGNISVKPGKITDQLDD